MAKRRPLVGKCVDVLLSCLVFGCPVDSTGLRGEDVGREVGRVDVKDLNEISGMAASRRNHGILWVHDDGDIDSAYAIRTSGDVVARLDLGKEAVDCEEMALGPGPGGKDSLYLADIGDNDEERESIRVFRCAEPLLASSTDSKLDAQNVETLQLKYPDGPHDAETLLVDPESGDMLIVTKEKKRARVYRAAAASWSAATPVTLRHAASLSVEKVSGGDMSRDGRRILLRREEVGWLFDRRGEEPLADALGRKPREVAVLGNRQDDNGEAVAFHPDGVGYYTVSEGKRQPICFFPLP